MIASVARNQRYFHIYQQRSREFKTHSSLVDIVNCILYKLKTGIHRLPGDGIYYLLNRPHALCGAHLLRELTALQEQGSLWAKHFKRYLLALYYLTDKGRKALSENQQAKALRLYDKLCHFADKQEVPIQQKDKGRPKASKGRNLLNRLSTSQQYWLLRFIKKSLLPIIRQKGIYDRQKYNRK